MHHQQKTPAAGGRLGLRGGFGRATDKAHDATADRATQHPEFIGIEGLLARLDGVRKTGPDRWIARCPTRDDRTPSLSIRVLDDGRVLLHDFGGAEFLDILAAVGIQPIELIPPHLRRSNASADPHRAPVPCCDALRAISFQASVIQIAAEAMARGERLNDVALDQLAQAVRTLDHAAGVIGRVA